MAVLGLHCCMGFSLVAVRGGYFYRSVQASHWGGFSCAAGARGHAGFRSCSSRALEHRLSSRGTGCFMARGIFPDQGLNPCLLCWQADSLPLSPGGHIKFLSLPPASSCLPSHNTRSTWDEPRPWDGSDLLPFASSGCSRRSPFLTFPACTSQPVPLAPPSLSASWLDNLKGRSPEGFRTSLANPSWGLKEGGSCCLETTDKT